MHLLLLVLFKFYLISALKPVVLMPGLIGSQLEARLNIKTTIFKCPKKQNWYSLWLNATQFENLNNGICFLDNFKLKVQNDGTTKNRKGVEIRCPKFGDTFAVEYMGPYDTLETKSHLMYFANFVDRLVNESYVRNQSIRGAPYDFRKAPNEMAEYLDRLTKLIEETYEKNGQKRVVMLGHSMGCMYTLYFLNHKDQAWKDKYVEAFIALGAPWYGSVLTLKALTSGDDFGLKNKPFIKFVTTLEIRGVARTMPSVSWLMPSSDAWKSDEILVRGQKRSYTVNDYEKLFDDVKFDNGMLLRRNTENLTRSLEHPGVKIYCIFSSIPNSTPDSFDYYEKISRALPWYDRKPIVKYGDGDGIVNLRSLEGCKKWPNATWKMFNDVQHRSMMNNTDIQDYIINILKQLNDI